MENSEERKSMKRGDGAVFNSFHVAPEHDSEENSREEHQNDHDAAEIINEGHPKLDLQSQSSGREDLTLIALKIDKKRLELELKALEIQQAQKREQLMKKKGRNVRTMNEKTVDEERSFEYFEQQDLDASDVFVNPNLHVSSVEISKEIDHESPKRRGTRPRTAVVRDPRLLPEARKNQINVRSKNVIGTFEESPRSSQKDNS